MKRSILFVDDEQPILELYKTLFAEVNEWEAHLARSGKEALGIMAQRSIDVVISDMRMPGMSGVELLTAIMERHPKTVRFIISGHADQEQVAKSVGAAHQFLPKPCTLEVLLSTVRRVCALDVFIKNERLKELITRMSTLPSIPTIYFRVLKELQSPGTSLERIGDLVASDLAMTAKLLQLVNSAFFGFSRRVSSPFEAVMLLGVSTVRSLCLSIQAFSCFDGHTLSEFGVEKISEHSVRTGFLAKSIAQFEAAEPALIEEAFIAGLLHDIGKLMLICNMPQEYRTVLQRVSGNQMRLCDAELEVFGSTHAAAGGYLLGLWGLPVPVVEAVALHHTPEKSATEGFSPLVAVHIANALAHEADGDAAISSQGAENLSICAKARLEFWRERLAQNPLQRAA